MERNAGRVETAAEEERVSVGRRTHDLPGADVATATRPVLDEEGLSEALRQPLTHQAPKDVVGSAGSYRYDDAHRPRRIGLGAGDPRYGRQRGSARGQVQELSANQFHGALLCSQPADARV